ncbi:14226_t:CDS:1, partial [Racocetra persica]
LWHLQANRTPVISCRMIDYLLVVVISEENKSSYSVYPQPIV